MRRITTEELTALQASIPRATEAHIDMTALGAADLDEVRAHLSHYAAPSEEGKCLACGERHTFTWGIAHGQGHCINCGWPATLYHFFTVPAGSEVRVVRLLQAHPGDITLHYPAEA